MAATKTKSESTELATQAAGASNGAGMMILRPRDFGELIQGAQTLGPMIKEAGLATTPGGGAVVLMICMSEGYTLKEFMRKYHKFDGQLTLRAGSAYADYLEAGGKVTWIEQSEQRCVGRWTFGDFTDVEIGFTIEEATRANLLKKDNWKSYPSDMLFNRCIMRALRRVAPSIVAGVSDPDEIEPVQAVNNKPVVNIEARRQELAAMASVPETIDVEVNKDAAPTSSTSIESPPADNRCTDEQRQIIMATATQLGVELPQLAAGIEQKYGCNCRDLTKEQALECIDSMKAMLEKKLKAAG